MVNAKQSHAWKQYAYIIIGATIVGLSYNIFFLPARLAAGGLSESARYYLNYIRLIQHSANLSLISLFLLLDGLL